MLKSGLTTEDIDMAIGVISGAFGGAWLEELIAKRKETPPLLQHPVMIGSASGSFPHLMEVIELSTYLVAFGKDKNISKTILNLKILEQYNDNLFQLAMAYRFKKLGFSTDLEPPIMDGQLGDFQSIKDNIKIMAECSVLHEWTVRETERNAFWTKCVVRLKQLYKSGGNQIIVDIVSKSALSFDTSFDQLEKDIMRAGMGFLKTGTQQKIANDIYEISVATMDPEIKRELDTDARAYFAKTTWDQIISFNYATATIPGDMTSVDLNQQKHQSLLRYKSTVRPEKEYSYSLEDRIDKKISAKTRQLRSHPNDFTSIFFVCVEGKIDEMNKSRVGKRLLTDTFKKIPSLNAVVIANRNLASNLSHRYQGTLFCNPSNPLDSHLFTSVNAIERNMDFVREFRISLNKK